MPCRVWGKLQCERLRKWKNVDVRRWNIYRNKDRRHIAVTNISIYLAPNGNTKTWQWEVERSGSLKIPCYTDLDLAASLQISWLTEQTLIEHLDYYRPHILPGTMRDVKEVVSHTIVLQGAEDTSE